MSSTQLQQVIAALKTLKLDQPTIGEIRAGFDQFMTAYGYDGPADYQSTQAGAIKAEWIAAPGADSGRVVLYLHGGGYVIGSIDSYRAVSARISRAAAARVLLIDYRLAPENPFPAAVEDSLAAYRWLLAQGISPARIALAGDSAGGGLTLATLVAIKEAGAPMAAAGVAISPWVDLEALGETMVSKAAEDPLVQRQGVLQMAAAYLAGKDPRTPLAAPLYADLRGLPPLLIQVGTAETLLDDAMRIAQRAREAGIEVTYAEWPNMVHVWHLFAAALDEGGQAIEELGRFVRSHAR